MAGDDDRARGRVAARNLGDGIAGCLVADRLRGEQQFHLERTGRALALADELIGIWVGYRSGRDRRHAIGEIRSEEHTSELQSLMRISYAVFCLKKKNMQNKNEH